MTELRGADYWRRMNEGQRILQGEETFSSFPSMNPVQRDMAFANGTFITENRYIMLLTLEEARQVTDELLGDVDEFFSYNLAPGNIKDILEGTSSIGKMMTFENSAGDIAFRFKSLGIRAIEYTFKGKTYIKITGYPGMRRILEGTRYAVDNPQMLEMGIGIRGLGGALIKGTKFCIFASLAWRVIELIFKSDYDLVDFLGVITMDAAKAVVASVVIGVIAGALTLGSAPVVLIAGIVIIAGVYLNIKLNKLDDKQGLSESLKEKLRFALTEYKRINEWNFIHSDPMFNYAL
ncbi:hypothetical protein [Rahnella woolbedingensis]|uniref:ImpA domain-containing protein n=1 Tax=Rahnella woolbedingensis TaxID=1510574 RepID=A0A419NE01_9GAMM|nr:hypothetical protein [Rahnella woolbedingensis]RJT46794.1 hypothetical protein D6C13_03115 [Rahnella woolbedingensis]